MNMVALLSGIYSKFESKEPKLVGFTVKDLHFWEQYKQKFDHFLKSTVKRFLESLQMPWGGMKLFVRTHW